MIKYSTRILFFNEFIFTLHFKVLLSYYNEEQIQLF
jgi:hypothetical protein